jgi:hypothetical protein
VCDSLWTGRADFLQGTNLDCFTHVTARLALLWIAWLLSGISLLLLGYTFWRLAPCYLRIQSRSRSHQTRDAVSAERRAGAQIMVLIMVLLTLSTSYYQTQTGKMYHLTA